MRKITFTPKITTLLKNKSNTNNSFSFKKSISALAVILALMGGEISFGQVAAYTFTQTSDTYTALSASTTIGATSWDDNVATVPIPFSFNFNGIPYTTASVNTNGYITFGTTVSGTAIYAPVSDAGLFAGAISAFAIDLVSATDGIVYGVEGTAPNRVFVVQWNNVKRYNATALADTVNFQIRLSETSHAVAIIYGACTLDTATGYFHQVGLRGAAYTDYLTRFATTTWSGTVVGTSNASTVTSSSTIKPASGLTFTYTQPVTTWVGGTSTAWNTAANWSPAAVPIATKNVIIPSGTTFSPTINAVATCGNITINSGATVTSGAFALTVNGDFINNGTFTGTSGSQVFSNTSTISGSGTTAFGPITIPSGVNLNMSSTCSATSLTYSSVTVNSSLTLTGTNTLTVSGAITFTGRPAAAISSYLNVNAGTVTCGTLVMGATTGLARGNFVNVTTGSFSTGAVTTAGVASQFVISSTGTINFSAAAYSTLPTITTATGSTVVYNGSVAQTVIAGTYSNLTLNGSGAKTTTGATVNGILSMQGTATTTGTIATYGAAATLEYKGSALQTTGTEFPATFAGAGGLIINNTFGVTLGAAKSLSALSKLTLTAGILTTSSTFLLSVLNTATTAISGGSATCFISGPVKWSLPTLAVTANYIFPVGKTNYYPFKLSPSTSTLPIVTVEAFNSAPTGGTFDTTLSALSTTEYWAVSNTGTYTQGTISLTRQTAVTAGNVIARSSTLAGVYSILGGIVSGSSINTSNVTGAALGYFCVAAPLVTITSATSGNWSNGETWVGGVVPTSASNAIIAHTVTMDNATYSTRTGITTVNAGGTLATGMTYTNNGTTTINGTFQLNSGGWANGTDLVYGSTGILAFESTTNYGVNADKFWPTTSGPQTIYVNHSSGITMNVARTVGTLFRSAGYVSNPSNLTINGTLQLNGGYNWSGSGSPTYGASSLLYYFSTGTPSRAAEWTTATSGAGYPANVQVGNNTTLGMGATAAKCSGNLSIDQNSTLNTTSGGLTVLGNVNTDGTISLGGDVTLAGNWTLGEFSAQTNNSKAVTFNAATGNQTITKTGGGTVYFDYLLINKATSGNLVIAATPATDVTINSTSGNVLQLLGAGGLDLNGRTLALNNSGGNIYVNGTRTITSTVANGKLDINQYKTISNNAGTGTLTFDTNVIVDLNTNGNLNFGNNISTVNGILSINSTTSCYVNTNPPIYGASSTLKYNCGAPYGRNLEWTTTSGAGYPNNVQISGNTTLDVGANSGNATARQMAGNLTTDSGSTFSLNSSPMSAAVTVIGSVINNGTLTLSSVSGGDISLKGNWTNAGTFTPNSRAVTFNGTGAQTLTGATTFDYLTMNNSSTGLTLNNSITVNQTLTLTSGKITLGANNLTTAQGITSSATNYIVTNGAGFLKRNAIGNVATLFPIGLNITDYTPITLTNTAGTSDLSVLVSTPITNTVADATKVVTLQWGVTSSAATTATVTPTWKAGNQGASFTNTGTGELANWTSAYTTYPVTLATTTITPLTGVDLQSGTNLIVVGNTTAVACNLISSLPWTENFDAMTTIGSAIVPTCWKNVTGSKPFFSSDVNNTAYSLGSAYNDPRSGTKYMTIAFSNTTASYLWTPGFAMTSGVSYDFSFWFAGDNRTGWTGDVVYNTTASSSGATAMGSSFITSGTTSTNATYSNVARTFVAPSTGTFYFAVKVISNGTPFNIGFDDFSMAATPACASAPASVSAATNIASTTATLNWAAATTAPSSGYEYYYSTSATSPTGATTATGSVGAGILTKNITGLTATTTYYFWVRSNCNGTDKSYWTGSGTFTTACTAFNIPYTMDFESATVPGFPTCTSISNAGTGNNWVTANNPGNGFTSKTLSYSYNISNAANAWFYTGGLNLTAGISYRLTYRYGNTHTNPENLKVAYGTSASSAAMTTTIDTKSSVLTTPTTATVDFIPATTGVYYLGYNCYSAADIWDLYVDDISVTETPAVGGTASGGTFICNGASTTLTLAGNTGTIQWQQSADGSTGWATVIGGSGGTTTSYTTPNLTATTYYRAFVTNGSTTATSTTATVSIYTTPIAPTASPTAMVLTPANTSVAGSFTASAGTTGYLVVRTTSATAPTNPTDNTPYVAAASGLGGTIVYSGALTTFTDTGLSVNTAYWYWVFPYNANCSLGPIYKTTSALSGTTTTLSYYNWIGAGVAGGTAGTDFNTATNWSPTGVPGATDEARFNLNDNADSTVSLSANTTIAKLVIVDATAIVSTNKQHTLNVGTNTLTVSGDCSVTNNCSGSVASNGFYDLNIGSGGTFNVGGNLTATNGNTSASGTINVIFFSNSGTMTVTGTTVAKSLNVSTTSQVQFNVGNSPATTTFGGHLTLDDGTSVIDNIIYLSGTTSSSTTGTFVFKGNFNWGTRGTVLNLGATHIFDAPVSQTMTTNAEFISNFNNVIIGSTNNPVVNIVTGVYYPTNILGNLTINGSSILNLGTSQLNRNTNGGTFTMSGTSQLKLGGASTNANGGTQTLITGSNFPSGFTTNTLAATSTVVYNSLTTVGQTIYATPTYGNLTLTNGTGSGATTKTAGAALTVAGDLLINSAATFAAGTSLIHNIAGDWTNNGSFSFTTANTINFNGAGSKTISGSSATAFNTIIINKGTDVTNVMEANGVGALSNTGTITMTSGLFKMTTGTFKFSSGPTIPNSAGIWINGATLNSGAFSYTNNGWIKVSSGTATFGTGPANAVNNQNTGYFEVTGGNVNLSGRLNNSANGTANTGVIGTGVAISGGTLTLSTAGNSNGTTAAFNMSATSNLNMTGGTVVIQAPNTNAAIFNDINILNSTGSKTITGGTFQMGNASTLESKTFIVNSVIPIYNFTVNATNAPIVKLVTNNLTIGSTLTLNGGNIDTNSLDVVVTNSATSAIAWTAGYINGNLTRALATTGVAYDYPVGLSATANYLPAALTFTNLTAGDLTVKATTGDETNIASSYIDDTQSVNAHWALSGTAASTNYAGTLNYSGGITDGTASATTFRIGKYDTVWTYPTVTPTPSATSLSFTAASGLGNLAIGNCKTPTAVVTSSQTICQGTVVNVTTATATNGAILWTHNGQGSLSGDTTLTPTYTPAAGDIGTTVTLTMTVTGLCEVKTATYLITVNAIPTATAGGTQTICQTGTATVSGATSSNGTILWTVTSGAGSLSGDTTLTPTYTPVAGDAGTTVTLTMTVSNSPCTAAVATYSVTVDAISYAGTPSADATICSGKVAIVSVTGSPTGTIQWQQSANGSSGWANVVGASGTTATYTSATLTATTYYQAVVTNGVCGATTSALITITIKSTTWSGTSWSPTEPDATTGIIFDGAYTSSADLAACSCTLTTNAVVTIAAGNTLSLVDGIDATSGAITFDDTSSLLQANNVTNTGAITYNRKTSALYNNYDFVYWGSPVAAQPLARMWMSVTSNDTFYSYNGGVNWVAANANSLMTPGLGYIARARNNGVGTDWTLNPLNNQTFTVPNTWEARFHGVPNNGEITVPIKKVGATFDNLIANPYPSAIDLELFWADNVNTDTSKKLTGNFSFWTHTNGIAVNAYSGGDYSIYNANSDVQTATENNGGTPDQYVDAGQGFFVEYASGSDVGTQTSTVKFKNSHRVSGYNAGFYRTALPNAQVVVPAIENHNVWLNLTNTIGGFKQLIIQYAQGATYGYDLYLDAISSQGNPNIDFYSIIPNRKFTINSRVLPFDNADTIDFGYHVGTAGTFQIAIDHVNGFFLTNENIYLEDKLLNITVDLRLAPYSFTTAIGTFNTRFVLHYLPTSTLGTGTINFENSVQVITNEKATVYSSNQNIKNIVVFDLLGRKIDSYKNVGVKQFTMNNLNKTMSGLFVKITLENDVVVTKKIVF
ncbi:Fibronectin type III [Flavobacteriaceae bacterium]